MRIGNQSSVHENRGGFCAGRSGCGGWRGPCRPCAAAELVVEVEPPRERMWRRDECDECTDVDEPCVASVGRIGAGSVSACDAGAGIVTLRPGGRRESRLVTDGEGEAGRTSRCSPISVFSLCPLEACAAQTTQPDSASCASTCSCECSESDGGWPA